MADESDNNLLTLTADIVAAHVSNNAVAVGDLPNLINRVHDALAGLATPQAQPPLELKPAISIRSSVRPDYVVCLEDGKKMKMLKRHLATDHGMTPAEYRAKWDLPSGYPMVAPNYAAQRKDLAVKIGLGRKPRSASTSAEPNAPKANSVKSNSAKPNSAKPRQTLKLGGRRKKAEAPES